MSRLTFSRLQRARLKCKEMYGAELLLNLIKRYVRTYYVFGRTTSLLCGHCGRHMHLHTPYAKVTLRLISGLENDEDAVLRPPPKPRRGAAAAAAPSLDGLPSSRGSKSPTQSIRSALSRRPRSAPQRRATISGTSSPSHRTYMNVCEVS